MKTSRKKHVKRGSKPMTRENLWPIIVVWCSTSYKHTKNSVWTIFREFNGTLKMLMWSKQISEPKIVFPEKVYIKIIEPNTLKGIFLFVILSIIFQSEAHNFETRSALRPFVVRPCASASPISSGNWKKLDFMPNFISQLI